MMDEEFVRANCNDPLHTTHTYGGSACAIVSADNVRLGFGVNEAEAWSAAVEFTRDRLEQIRQLETEIEAQSHRERQCAGLWWEWANDPEGAHPSQSDYIVREVRKYVREKRILSRLESILADLKRGMK